MKINNIIRFRVKIIRFYNYLYKNLDAIFLGRDCHNVGEHAWMYNFPSLPNKRICSDCKKKEVLNLKTLEWGSSFVDHAGRTDQELIDKWFY